MGVFFPLAIKLETEKKMRAIICDAFKRNTRHESIIFAIDYSFGWAHYYALNSEGKTIYILDESCLGPEDSLDFTVYMTYY